MRPRTRAEVAVVAGTIAATNGVVALIGTSPMASLAIGLVASSLATYHAIRLPRGKRNGQHRRTEADTPDPETSGTSIDPNGSFALHCASALHARDLARAWAVEASRVEPTDGLERVESDMPILAHRSARLRLDGTSLYFCSVVEEGARFGVDAEASCGKAWKYMVANIYDNRPAGRPHKAPDPRCECGFYALPTDSAPTIVGVEYVTLMVELSGTVIEHEKGYRAEHQRVVECQIQPCVYCGAEADLLVVRGFLMEQATCAAHKPVDEPGVVYLDIADLAEVLPVPVTRAGRRLRHAGGEG